MLMTVKTRDLNHKKNIMRVMAETGTELLHVSAGKEGDVVFGLGGTLVSPPLAVDRVEHYFGRVKGFPATTELIDIMKNGVPVKKQSRTSTLREQFGMVTTAQCLNIWT